MALPGACRMVRIQWNFPVTRRPPDSTSLAPKLYHRKTPDFRGHDLYPLNRLKDVAPDLYDRQRAKYAGREDVMQQRVPQLNCLWNDLLHFTPLHPAQVAQLARSEGLVWHEAKWFEIDPVAAGFTSANTAVFRYANIDLEYPIPRDEFESFDIERLALMCDLPQPTRDYYRSIPRGSSRYFIFAGVPHVLHRGSVDIEKAPVVVA